MDNQTFKDATTQWRSHIDPRVLNYTPSDFPIRLKFIAFSILHLLKIFQLGLNL